MRVLFGKLHGSSYTLVLWLGTILSFQLTVSAEQLPLKRYTTSDGLVRDYVTRIVRDSLGYLWFCTPEGLSRFDGYSFTNYGNADGLPASVRDILPSHDGTYWIATGAGLYRFDPTQSTSLAVADKDRAHSVKAGDRNPKFAFYGPAELGDAGNINVVREDRTGVIWCGTDAGLYRLDQFQGSWRFTAVDIGLPASQPTYRIISTIIEDRQGTLWVGSSNGLYLHVPGGGFDRYTTHNGLPFDDVRALLEDRDGTFWVGTTLGLAQLARQSDQIRVEHRYSTKDGLPHNWITCLLQTDDGGLWVGTNGGIGKWEQVPKQRSQTFRSYTSDQGLSSNEVQSLAEDADGQVWIGTESGGAMKVARNGFSTYTEAEGLSDTRIASIFEDQTGELCVISSRAGALYIHRFNGRDFTVTKLNSSPRINYGWGWNQIAFQDTTGEWWVPTIAGLYRYRATTPVEQLGRVSPRAIYTTRDGLSNDQIFRLYEDSRHDIWVSANGPNREYLSKWNRATGKIEHYGEAEGLPSVNNPTVFREDPVGNLWIGYYGGGLVRYRSGSFRMFSTKDGLPDGMVRDLHVDRTGKLWIATSRGGIGRLDDLASDHPQFLTYTTAQGLASNQTTCVIEDQHGRIYIGSSQGVDRLEPDSGQIKHYSVVDGLANNFVNVAYRDHLNTLWFGTLQGLSRLFPESDAPSRTPSIFISGLRIAGENYAISPLGDTDVIGPELNANQNDVEITFSSISTGAAQSLHYQYKLEGATSDWSVPTTQRSITYARLSSGTYRFLVRAINATGTASEHPAVVSFSILRPVWQRWWFLSLALVLVGAVAYAAHRYTVRRLLELERVRTRIATDLHDDIGSSLSQIAILSEVASQHVGDNDPRAQEPLKKIAGSSRELVDAMSDIVWSINPHRDRVRDLSQRMRRFASDMFTAREIAFQFHAPSEKQDAKVGTDIRRQVFLIFKESINNAVRHSGCTNADIELRIDGNSLTLRISDNGKGLRHDAEATGHGLMSMNERAKSLGGNLEITSTNGDGTVVLLKVPIGGHQFWRRQK